jgi:GTPase SAR1 family protein
MRIAITGAHRVGKTTLAEKLQEYLTDYEYKLTKRIDYGQN